jgi:hypothetical protein
MKPGGRKEPRRAERPLSNAFSRVVFAIALAGVGRLTAAAPTNPQSSPVSPRNAEFSRRHVSSPVEKVVWQAPASAGEWCFDLFSPPEIFFDEAAGSYVRADRVESPPAAPRTGFPLRLLALLPEPFPLRLIGHLGDVTEKRAVFEDRVSGEIFVAAAGQLTGRHVDFRELVGGAPGTLGDATEVVAIVRMAGFDTDVSLAEGQPGQTGRWRARLELTDGSECELTVGESIEVDGGCGRVAEIIPGERRLRLEWQRPGETNPRSVWLDVSADDHERMSKGDDSP